MNINAIMQLIAIAIIPLVFAITLHEAAHGWVASKLGDTTALMLGRVTANPAKHIDPFGTIILPILTVILTGFMFGWAKPVPINYNNLRNVRRDMCIVAIAGPLANLLMALFWGLIAKFAIMLTVSNGPPALKTITAFIYLSSQFGIFINCILIVLNLLPIPPLDGSRVVSAILPPSLSSHYDKIEPYGIWILLILLVFGLLGLVLLPAVLWLTVIISKLYGIIPFHMLIKPR